MIGEQVISVRELISNVNAISSTPRIYSRLNDAINHPRTAIKDIARIISEDPGLTARLLKLANSSLYGFPKIDSISRALTLIGTRELRDLTLATTVIQSFADIPEDQINVESYWKHCLACGTYARNIAVYLREPSVEKFFVGGILHDIGQLVMCALIPKTVCTVYARGDQNAIFSIEQESLGFDHAHLGSELLSAWEIPQNITELVAFHNNPSQATKYPLEATIVHLADLICQATGYRSSTETSAPPLDETAYAKLNFPASALESIINQTEAQLADVFATLLEQ